MKFSFRKIIGWIKLMASSTVTIIYCTVRYIEGVVHRDGWLPVITCGVHRTSRIHARPSTALMERAVHLKGSARKRKSSRGAILSSYLKRRMLSSWTWKEGREISLISLSSLSPLMRPYITVAGQARPLRETTSSSRAPPPPPVPPPISGWQLIFFLLNQGQGSGQNEGVQAS